MQRNELHLCRNRNTLTSPQSPALSSSPCLLPGELNPSQSLATHSGQSLCEAVTVVHVLAIIEAVALLCQIAVHVERLDCDVGSGECPFQARPEVLNALSVNVAAHIFLDVVRRRCLRAAESLPFLLPPLPVFRPNNPCQPPKPPNSCQ